MLTRCSTVTPYGFALQEASLRFEGPGSGARLLPSLGCSNSKSARTRTSSRWRPNTSSDPATTSGNEFEFGLDLILDALTRTLPDTTTDSTS